MLGPPFFRSLTIARIFRNAAKNSLTRSEFMGGVTNVSASEKKDGPSIKLAGSAQTLFFVVFFLSRHFL
jgi:hypothetical protein